MVHRQAPSSLSTSPPLRKSWSEFTNQEPHAGNAHDEERDNSDDGVRVEHHGYGSRCAVLEVTGEEWKVKLIDRVQRY